MRYTRKIDKLKMSIEDEVQKLAGHLTIRQQKILREFLIREAKEYGRDYIYGVDEGVERPNYE